MPSLTKVQSGFMEAQGALPLSPGTAAAPGLKFDDHAGTGMFSPSTGEIAFSTSGHSQAITFKTDGKVGIGIDNPDAKLHIKGSGGGTGLTFKSTDGVGNTNFWIKDGGRVGVHYYPFVINRDHTDPDPPSNTYFYVHGSSPFIVKSDGNVGIGTDTPGSSKLKIEGGSGTRAISLNAPTNGTYITFETAGTAYADIGAEKGVVGSGSADTPVINARGSRDLAFRTNSNERLRITAAGDINIGTVGRFDASGLVKSAHGSESSPSHSFLNDPDNGMYRPTTNTLGLVTGGSEKLRITSGGSVGIGTNNPDTILHIMKATDNELKIETTSNTSYGMIKLAEGDHPGAKDKYIIGYNDNHSAQADQLSIKNQVGDITFMTGGVALSDERLRITSGGLVGIGTVAPFNNTSNIDIRGGSSALSDGGQIVTIGVNTKADNTPQLAFGVSDADGYGWIRSYASGVGGKDLVFASVAENLRITSAGKVGIGTDSPRTVLEINGAHDDNADTITPVLRLSTGNSYNGTNTGSGLEFGTTNTTYPTWVKGRIGCVYNGSSSYGGHLVFQTNTGSGPTTISEKMRIKDNGNVGIGTQEPDLKLHINGANALPSSSGSTATGYLTLRNKAGSSSHGMFMGVSNAAPWSSWIQAQDASNNATSYPLLLNPNGGNVGIGNDNPTVALDVKKATAGTIAKFYDTGSNGGALYNGGPILGLSRVSNGSVSLNGLLFQVGIDNSNSTSYNIDETVFCVANTGVGIGLGDPQHLLHLNKGTSATTSYKDATMLNIRGTNNANVMAGIGFSYSTSNPSASAYPSAWIGAKVSSWTAYVKHDLVFATRGVDTNTEPTERFRITEGGELHQNYDSRYKQQGHFTTNTSAQNNTNSPSLATALSYSFGYQEGFSSSNGGWSFPYPKLVLGYHTGINLGGHRNYYGCRFFEDHPSNSSSIVLSVGNQSTGVHVTNTLTAGTKTFRIVHPHPSKKYTHDLVHSVIEGPQCDNIYRGKVDLVNGTASINIDTVSNMTDGTFVLLNRDIQCFTSNETGWTAVKGSVSGNILTITAKSSSCTDTISWMVIGERQDDKIKSPEIEITDSDGKLIIEPLTIEQTHM